MTRRPKLTPENYQAVYEHYAHERPMPRTNRAIFSLGDMLYNPDVLISDRVRKEIEFQLLIGKGALLASNHPSGHDPMVLAGAVHQLDIPGLDTVRAVAKDSLFHGIMRPSTEATGCIPVFRRHKYPEIGTRKFLDASHAMIDLVAAELQRGQAIAILPEGTNSAAAEREQLDPRKIKVGIAQAAIKAGDQSSFIIPIGIHYRTDNPLRKRPSRHPAVAIGMPITSYEHSSTAVKNQIYKGMQGALNRATNHVSQKPLN